MLANPNVQTTPVEFQIDTISTRDAAIAYFLPSSGTITVNFSLENERYNQYAQSDAVLIHEQKHKDNVAAGLFSYPVSPEQSYKLCMHDEISANIAQLVFLRQKYLETGDINVFCEYDVKKFAFYANAVKNGRINPRSEYIEDFNYEMSFIVNGMQKMWERKYADKYINTGLFRARRYSDFSGKYIQYHNQNYEYELQTIYKVGGINFYNYMQKDMKIPIKARTKLDNLITLKSPKKETPHFFSRIGSLFKHWFGDKEPVVENKQIFKVAAELPMYKIWEDKEGCRISEIMSRDLPDLQKQFILIPKKSYIYDLSKTVENLRLAGHDARHPIIYVKSTDPRGKSHL